MRLWNLPASQGEHSGAPRSENVPGSQSVHVAELLAPSTGDAVPLGHSVQLVPATSVENDPGGHGAQSSLESEPLKVMNVPGAHGVHASFPEPSAYVATGHVVHVSRPASGANVPPAHASHESMPRFGATVPGPHASHWSRAVARS